MTLPTENLEYIYQNKVCDISNAVMQNCRDGRAKLNYINLIFNALKNCFWIIGIADTSLYKYIDDIYEYKTRYLERYIRVKSLFLFHILRFQLLLNRLELKIFKGKCSLFCY